MQIKYKGFEIGYYFDGNSTVFYGEVVNCSDLIAFQANNPADLEMIAKEAIDHYLQKEGEKRNKNLEYDLEVSC